ncbi:MAG: hypothetical protein ACYCOU_15020 [Sulfobacillus sp.]
MVITTAPTGRQVRELLWRDIKKLVRRAKQRLPGRLLTQMLEIAPDWWAMGFSSNNPTAVQGLHEAENVFFVEDEAAGMDPDVIESFEGITASPNSRHLKIGNPADNKGPFYDAVEHGQGRWHVIHIDAEQTPNVLAGKVVVPGLVTREWVEDKRLKWGESHPQWITKVKGRFAKTAGEKVIPPRWAELAQDRWLELNPQWRDLGKLAHMGRKVFGVDIGRTHDDSVICMGVGSCFRCTDVYHIEDTVGNAEYIAARALEEGVEAINIDGTGLGIGVYDNLRRIQENGKLGEITINVIVFSRSAEEPDLYERLLDEMQWNARKRFDPAGQSPIAIDPDDQELKEELSLRGWTLTTRGKIKVQTKKEVVAQFGKSPDKADALVAAVMAVPEMWII